MEADLALVSACGGGGGVGRAGGGQVSPPLAAADADVAAAAAAANLLSAPATVPSLEDRTRGRSSPGSDFETAPAVPAIGGGGGGGGRGSERLLLTSSGTGGGGGGATATTTATTATTSVEEGGSGAGGADGSGSGGGCRRTRRSARAAAAAAASNAASGEQQQQAIVVRGGGKDKEAAAAAAAAANGNGANTALALFDPSAAHRARKRRVAAQFDSLQECYLSLRREREGEATGAASGSEATAAAAPCSSVDAVAASAAAEVLGSSSAAASASQTVGGGRGGGLAEFSRLLSTFVRCSELEVLARLPAAAGGGAAGSAPSRRGGAAASTAAPALALPPPPSSSTSTPRSIVSSLDFDASGRWLATAAVAKRVSVFDFEQVLRAGRAERRWWNERRRREGDDDNDEEGGEEQGYRRRRRAVRGAGRDGDSGDGEAPPAPPRPVFELTTRSKLSCAVWAKTRSDSAAAQRRSQDEEERGNGSDDEDDTDGDDDFDEEDEAHRRPQPPPLLVSTDYCGCATVWDCSTGRPLVEYDAHDRRAWSADWSPAAGGSSVFATASDDGTAKVWALHASGSSAAAAASSSPSAAVAPSSSSSTSTPVITLDVRANVCSAAFDASDPAGHTLALGAADHAVRVFDLRSPRAPLHVLSGHRKAASYVRWGAGGLVSASTDSTLRLWPLPKGSGTAAAAGDAPPTTAAPPVALRPPRVFKGHVNERNFVGLAADPRHDLLAAGSETGEIVVWHASMARPVARARVSSGSVIGSGGTESDSAPAAAAASTPQPFVSAVAWRPLPDHLYPTSKSASSSLSHDVERATYTLVAANAHGALQVMRLGGGGGGRSKASAAERSKRRRRELGIADGDEDDDGFGDGDGDGL